MFTDDQTLQQSQAEPVEENAALITCQDELKNLKESYVLLMADFENYKKRSIKDNDRIIFNAQTKIILNFLPIIDNISRFAKTVQQDKQQDLTSLLDGLALIEKESKRILETLDIKEVQMQTFDPEIHEAIAQVAIEGKEAGSIIDYVEKGYTYKGLLLRPAKVAVAQ